MPTEPALHAVLDVPADVIPARLLRRLAQGGGDPTFRADGTDAAFTARTTAGPAAAICTLVRPGRVDVRAFGPGAEALAASLPGALGALDRPDAFAPGGGPVARLARRGMVRLGTAPSLVGVLVPTILGQKVQARAAADSYRRLCFRFGGPGPGPSGLMLPPDPARLAFAGYEELHPANVERRRAEVIRRVCRDRDRLDRLPMTVPPEEIRRLLCLLPGVGPWTAAVATLLTCGDPDAVIVGDFHLPNVVAWALAGEPRADDERMLALLAPYPGQRARVQLLCRRAQTRVPRYGPRLAIRDIRSA